VLARRIIVVSPDKPFGKQVAVALKAAGGTIDVHASPDALATVDAALVVLHLDGPDASAAREILNRLVGETRMIAILPRSNLAAVVDIMQASDRVAGVLVAEAFDPHELSAMATRVLAGDLFGLEKLIRWGTQIHSQLVGDYPEKSRCIAQISELAAQLGVRRKYRAAIEQCIDEMLMNALYDAPGRQSVAAIPTQTRSWRVDPKVVVQYACDGQQLAVAVRDAFGTLERATVLRYLHKCLHRAQQLGAPDEGIIRKSGGAGLGLYLMVSNATQVYFNVLPGAATEAVCAFDLTTPKLHLDAFGFFVAQPDARGRLAAGAPRELPAGTDHPVERRAPRARSAPAAPTGVVAALVVAIVVTLALITYVAVG